MFKNILNFIVTITIFTSNYTTEGYGRTLSFDQSIITNIQLVDTIDLPNITAQCPVGYFRCNGTAQCIAQRKNCDDIADCDDGSDEWHCDDHSEVLFWDHLYRKRPAAKSDDLPLGVCEWPSLNNSCFCRGNELHCSYRKLKLIPNPLPEKGLSLLDLTGNYYETLTAKMFENLTEVEILVFHHCNIKEITNNAFQRFNKINIHTIYFNQNELQNLPEELFPPGTMLHVLILSGNKINSLQDRTFVNLNYLEELDLRDNQIPYFNEALFQPLQNLKRLYLSDNKLTALHSGMLPKLNHLTSLSMANNQIRYISKDTLNFPYLEQLYLSGNQLTEIENNTFQFLPNLLGLKLNENKITVVQLNAFNGLNNLTSLYLSENVFETLDSRILQNLTNLQYIYFSTFQLCRAALHVRSCEPKGDGISSVKNLLENPVLRASVLIMAAVSIVGNLIVLFGRRLTRKRESQGHAQHTFYLKNLAVSDFLMGVYLAIIAIADIIFRDEYLLHEEKWRYSTICAFCGLLSTLSCQSSTMLLALVTWDRFVSVTRPLQSRLPSKSRGLFRLCPLWSCSWIIAIAPLSKTNYFGTHFYGNNGVCLSLHIHDAYAKGWEYSSIVFIVINTIALLFIVFLYLRMLKAIRYSGEAIRSTMTGRENVVARRFAIIILTDCCCWLPVIIVKLSALAGVKISPNLYGWLAVFVLPVNSALNPVLYTLTTTSFKEKMLKFFYSLPCVTAELSTNSAFESGLSASLGNYPSIRQKRLVKKTTTQNTLTSSVSSTKRAAAAV